MKIIDRIHDREIITKWIIDEIQRAPELFPLLRYLVDQDKKRKFVILGSASRDLIRQSSESLAGRIAYYYLGGFRLQDIGTENMKIMWLRGTRSFLTMGRTKLGDGIQV
jgi:uncharacterized protein